MRTSDTIDLLAAALASAQSEIRPAIKDANNPAFNSKYADLAAIFDAARPALAKHGLCVVQMPEHSYDALVHLTTRVAHKSGQWIEATMSMPVGKVNAHGYGSAITYCRRYAYAASIGIVADEDDDGNKASLPAARPITGAQVALDEFDKMTPEHQKMIREWAMEVIAFCEDGKPAEAAAFAREQCGTDQDSMLALSSQLPSNVRAALKAVKGK